MLSCNYTFMNAGKYCVRASRIYWFYACILQKLLEYVTCKPEDIFRLLILKNHENK